MDKPNDCEEEEAASCLSDKDAGKNMFYTSLMPIQNCTGNLNIRIFLTKNLQESFKVL